MRWQGWMIRLCTIILALATTILINAPVFAGDYDQVLSAVQRLWPDKTTAAAICSVDWTQQALLDLTDAAKSRGISLMILNVKTQKDVDNTLNNLLSRRPQFMILIEGDPMVGIKSRSTDLIIGRAAARRIPTVALTEEGLSRGAVMAAGEATKGKVLWNVKVAKKLELPQPTDTEAR